MKKKIAISLAVGCLISAATLYLAFRNVPFGELVAYLGKINYWWLFPTVLIVIATYILRVYRWRLILLDAATVGFAQAFHPLMIGFMINCVLPGRLGELARPVILKRNRQVPVSTGLATVAAERMMDIVALIILFSIVFSTLTIQPDLKVVFGSVTLNQETLKAIAWALIRLSLLLLVAILSLSISWSRQIVITIIRQTGRWTKRLSRAEDGGFVDRLTFFFIVLIDNIAVGLKLVHSPGRLAACAALTMAIWGLSGLAYYVFAFGCPGIILSFWQMTAVMVIVCFFIALPSVPGFWGLWEAGGVFAMSLFGVAKQEAAGFTLANHAAQMFPVIIVGLISAVLTSVNIFKIAYGGNAGVPTAQL